MSTFIESEINSTHYNSFDQANTKKSFSIDFSKLFHRETLIYAFLMFLGLFVPFLVFLVTFDDGDFSRKMNNICLVDNIYRLPCGRENISQINCTRINCCYEIKTNSCYHSEPSSYYFYKLDSGDYRSSKDFTPLGLPSSENINLSIISEPQSLRIILNDIRASQVIPANDSSNFDVRLNDNNKLAVSVYRKSTGDFLFTTQKGPLIASQQYLEWTIQLTNSSGMLFGLGGLKMNINENSTLTKVIYKNQDDHNTLPMFMAYNNRKYHAIVIEHEGLLQVTVLPSFLISLTCISGRKLEIRIVDGPRPEDIYNKLQGNTSLIPEWSLGVQICREEPGDSLKSVLKQYNDFVSRKKDYPEFAYESDCIHDDLLLHLFAENQTSSEIETMFTQFDIQGFQLSFPPHIPLNSELYEKYKDHTIFFKNRTTGETYVGNYKRIKVVYPNYRNENITSFLDSIKALFQNITIQGITLTNSWPQDDSFVAGNSTEPFITKNIQETLSYTLPWSLKEDEGIHMRYHNEYGPALELKSTDQFNVNFSLSSVPDPQIRKPLIMQNFNTTWSSFKKAISISLYNSLFGYNLLAVPICGSNEYNNTIQEDLCLRWYLFGATTPLVRISSRGTPRDPTNLNSDYAKKKVISILEKRASFIPFYRTIMSTGAPIMRPMFYNFPNDEKVHDLDEQYMIGDGVLVAQPTAPEIEIASIYLPPEITWYEIWGGQNYRTEKHAEWIKLPIVKSDWISFIAEGHIIPQVSKWNSSNLEITLISAMNCKDTTCEAEGSLLLYLPNESVDVSVKFSAKGKKVEVKSDHKSAIMKMIKSIRFYTYTENWTVTEREIIECLL